MDPKVEKFMAGIRAKNPAQPEFHQAVHEVARARSRHALDERQVVTTRAGAVPGEEAGGCRCAADNHDAAILGFDGVVGRTQHLGVRLRADVAIGPFTVDILLVPHLDSIGAKGGNIAEIAGEILIILGGACCQFAGFAHDT